MLAIVEHKDADPSQLAIREINSGIYVFDADVLRAALTDLAPSPVTGELYLTDVIEIARGQQRPVAGPSDHRPLGDRRRQRPGPVAADGRRDQSSNLRAWMRAGVTILDPASTWIQADVDLGTDVTLLPGVSLEGATSVAGGATIGPDTTLVDVEVGPNATVTRTQATLSVIGAGATVGPFAYLRPGSRLGARGKIGTFVETKNATIGDGAKVPHLTYAGDTEIGDGANIGAGTIFANYDGVAKHRSSVGRSAFVGSNSVLIHPVRIGDGSYVAAGSAVTEDVEAGDLAAGSWPAAQRAGLGGRSGAREVTVPKRPEARVSSSSTGESTA